MVDLWVEIVWPVGGDRVPVDHGYLLYSSLCHQDPQIKEMPWQLGTITGKPQGQWLSIQDNSTMMIRCPVSELARFQGLDNKLLRVGSGFIELGQLEGRNITEKSELTARLVIIKAGGDAHSEPFQFGVAVGKKIAGLKCHIELGPRRCLRTKDHKIIGYGLTLSKLLPEISIELQCNGLGGKQRMGCGVLI